MTKKHNFLGKFPCKKSNFWLLAAALIKVFWTFYQTIRQRVALLSLAALVKEKALSASAPQHSALQGYKKQLKAITLTFCQVFFCCPLKMCVCGIMKVLYCLEVFVMIVQWAVSFSYFLSINFSIYGTLFLHVYFLPKQNNLEFILSFC